MAQKIDPGKGCFLWPGAVHKLQDYFQHGSPVKTLQGRLGEYTSDH